MNSTVDISIIVMAYFHEQYIKRAIDSILSQNIDANYEIIVADDCSKDKTIEIVNEFCHRYPNIIKIYSNEENLGICRNLYQTFLKCAGKYIVITDGDDYWVDDEKLSKEFMFLEKNRDFFAVSTSIEGYYTDGEKTGCIYPQERYRGKEITRKMFLKGVDCATVGMMFRNVFDSPKACEQFSLLPVFSRDLDDLTFCIFMFDYGRVFNLAEVTYAITVRRNTDINQHNYNTKYVSYKKDINRIDVLNGINKYYNGKLNLTHKYETSTIALVSAGMKYKQKEALSYLKRIPIKYVFFAFLRWPFIKLGIIK